MRRVDLHTHTTCSDGTVSPTELVRLARNAGLAALAVTDHDTTEGLPEARAAGEAYGVEIISGCEISTNLDGQSVHVLGHGFTKGHAALEAFLQGVRDGTALFHYAASGPLGPDEFHRVGQPTDDGHSPFAGAGLQFVAGLLAQIPLVDHHGGRHPEVRRQVQDPRQVVPPRHRGLGHDQGQVGAGDGRDGRAADARRAVHEDRIERRSGGRALRDPFGHAPHLERPAQFRRALLENIGYIGRPADPAPPTEAIILSSSD